MRICCTPKVFATLPALKHTFVCNFTKKKITNFTVRKTEFSNSEKTQNVFEEHYVKDKPSIIKHVLHKSLKKNSLNTTPMGFW